MQGVARNPVSRRQTWGDRASICLSKALRGSLVGESGQGFRWALPGRDAVRRFRFSLMSRQAWSIEALATQVDHDILFVAVFRRQASALAQVMVRTGASVARFVGAVVQIAISNCFDYDGKPGCHKPIRSLCAR